MEKEKRQYTETGMGEVSRRDTYIKLIMDELHKVDDTDYIFFHQVLTIVRRHKKKKHGG